jgi:hypothetical protein
MVEEIKKEFLSLQIVLQFTSSEKNLYFQKTEELSLTISQQAEEILFLKKSGDDVIEEMEQIAGRLKKYRQE